MQDLYRDRRYAEGYPDLEARGVEWYTKHQQEIRANFPAGLLAPVVDQPLRFSYRPIVGSPEREVRWREMPRDLRTLTR